MACLAAFVQCISGGMFCRAMLLVAMDISKKVDDFLSNPVAWSLEHKSWKMHNKTPVDPFLMG